MPSKFKNQHGTYYYTLYKPLNPNGVGVVFAPGKMTFSIWYKWVGKLAAEGYSVLAFNIPFTKLTSKDPMVWADGIMTASQVLGTLKTVAAGHSFGGNGAIIAGRFLDCVVAFSPGWAGEDREGEADDIMRAAPGLCTAPTLVVVGELDGITGKDAAIKNYDGLAGTGCLHIKAGANHIQYLDPGIQVVIGNLFDNKPLITSEEQLGDAFDQFLLWINDYT